MIFGIILMLFILTSVALRQYSRLLLSELANSIGYEFKQYELAGFVDIKQKIAEIQTNDNFKPEHQKSLKRIVSYGKYSKHSLILAILTFTGILINGFIS